MAIERTEQDTRTTVQFLRLSARRELAREVVRCQAALKKSRTEVEVAVDALTIAKAELETFDAESTRVFGQL